MQWVAENWIVLLLVGGMIAMHLFGHGHGHAGRGKHKSKNNAKTDDTSGSGPKEES
jgi:hypothetical protein